MLRRVAVIGSGAAAVAAMRQLSRVAPEADITVVDAGKEETAPFQSDRPFDQWSPRQAKAFYRHLHQQTGRLRFPPPKSRFGLSLTPDPVAGWGNTWKSDKRGGLTTMWGGSAVPLTAEEFAGFPYDRAELDPYYRQVAEMVGVAGRADALSADYPDAYVTRPPVDGGPLARRLEEHINGHGDGIVAAGAGRLAVETRSGHPGACINCGDCMIGCHRGAIWDAGGEFLRLMQEGRIHRRIKGEVRSIDRTTGALHVAGRDGAMDTTPPFDRVYVAAGCVGTTEIVMRTLDITEGLVMDDSAVFTFVCIYLGRNVSRETGYFGMTSLLGLVRPTAQRPWPAFLQFYPVFDHLWRYLLPASFWGPGTWGGRLVRGRLALMRTFLHGAYSQSYAFVQQRNGTVVRQLHQAPPPLAEVPDLLPRLNAVLNTGPFRLLPARPCRQKTSAHYAGSLPMGGAYVDNDASLCGEGRIYLCDSAVFPYSPASSLTLTIMAHAARTVDRSL